MPTNVRCVNPWSHGTHRGDSPIPATHWSAHGRPALFPLYRHPVVWNCWYQCLMLLEVGDHCWIVTRMPVKQKQLIRASQISTHKTLSAPESPLLLCYITDQERKGEWECARAQNLNTCCFIPCWKLTSVRIFKTIIADWNHSNHFDTPYIQVHL
jgi:hypothetical protein